MIEITPSFIFMITGFLLSLYACVSNDVIQTLGTFLNTTKHRPVWQIWLFTSAILLVTFVSGWYINDGDMAFGLLDRIPHPDTFYWWHILPPIILLYLTKKGIPVATAFLIISVFSSSTIIGMMIAKSFIGYVSALFVSLILYFFIARKVEKIFLYKKKQISKPWIVAKWVSTAILWTAWLLQDGAKLFVFLPRKLTFIQMILCMAVFVALLYIICYKRGGEIQNIIKLKTNTQDVRSATIIDIVYACILIYFLNLNNIPMSTTWVFLGVLAGREIALYNRLRFITEKKVYKYIIKDFTKAIVGLVVSIGVVFILNQYDKIMEIIRHYINL